VTLEDPAPSEQVEEIEEVERVVDRFFAGFVSGEGAVAGADDLRAVLLPGAVLVNACGAEPVVQDVEGFIAPRLALLTSGRLASFREARRTGRTEVFGGIAQHWCSYEKSWREDGEERTGAGMKGLQLVRTAEGWRISALVWDDEPPLTPPARG
jgi:hypothetical protein